MNFVSILIKKYYIFYILNFQVFLFFKEKATANIKVYKIIKK